MRTVVVVDSVRVESGEWTGSYIPSYILDERRNERAVAVLNDETFRHVHNCMILGVNQPPAPLLTMYIPLDDSTVVSLHGHSHSQTLSSPNDIETPVPIALPLPNEDPSATREQRLHDTL